MKNMQLVDNKGMAGKITANTSALSIDKNAVTGNMQKAANKKNAPKLSFKHFLLYLVHNVWFVGRVFLFLFS